MKKTIILVFIAVFLYLVAAYVYKSYIVVDKDSTEGNIEFILGHINSRGKLIDYRNEIGVKDVSDIKLYVKGDKIELMFGKIKLSWRTKDFVSKANRDKLEKLGIRVYKDAETKKLRVFYGEDEIERWVH